MAQAPENYESLITDDHFIRWVRYGLPEDDQYWQQWLQNNPLLEDDMLKAREFVGLMEFKPNKTLPSELDNIYLQIEREIEPASGFNFSWSSMRIAASITLLIMCGWFLYAIIQGQLGRDQVVETRMGQKTSMILADGTKVWLNGGSRLEVSYDFKHGDIRKVELAGEAFFEVAHNPERPFIVHTNNLNIKVLGTAFNVRSYHNEKAVETALLQGSVEIEVPKRHNKIQLQPDHIAVLEKEIDKLEVRPANVAAMSAWRNGVLVFQDESFDRVARTLERWYGVDIEILEGADCEISAKFEGESLNEVLQLLKLTSSVNYSVSDNKVKLNIQCDNRNEFPEQ